MTNTNETDATTSEVFEAISQGEWSLEQFREWVGIIDTKFYSQGYQDGFENGFNATRI